MPKINRRQVLQLTTGAVAAGMVAGVETPAEAASKDGWWVRVNTKKTEASSISFQIGTSKKDRRGWRTWKSNEATEFDVPKEFKNVAELYVHATANPNDKNAWFCVMYRNNGVKHFDFDDDEDHQMKQSDHDGEC